MSDDTARNPYAAPTSDLQLPIDNEVPSIEQALARGYDFNIGDLISESWSKVKGTKGIILSGFLVFYVVSQIVIVILGNVSEIFGASSDNEFIIFVGEILISLLGSALAYPFMAGVNMIGIRRAADQPLSFNEIFSHFDRTLPLVITSVMMMLLTYLGIFLLLIPGIYLGVAYLLAIPLVVERGLSPWQAMEASRKAITQHWFKVFGLFLVLGLLVMFSAIPLGIGLIWTMPLMTVATGVLYRTIFGVLPAAQ